MKDEQNELDDIFAKEEKKPKDTKNIIIGATIVLVALAIAAFILFSSKEDGHAQMPHKVEVKDEVVSPPKDPNAELDKIIQEIKSSHGKDLDKNISSQDDLKQNLSQSDVSDSAQSQEYVAQERVQDSLSARNHMEQDRNLESAENVKSMKAMKLEMAPRNNEKSAAAKMDKKKAVALEGGKPIKPVKKGTKATKGVYLQVGVFSKQPSKKFLQTLKKHKYRTLNVTINDQKLVKYLVGPFKNRSEAHKYKVANSLDSSIFFEVK